MSVGTVYLVGAGPGDPGLLTVKAKHLLSRADVVVYDRLLSPAILHLARQDAMLLYVGKESSNHAVPQDVMNQRLVELAKSGYTVVRLKGGDPFVFGRGGEEAEVLKLAGVPYEIVPGVTSAIGAAAYAGIPVTHRLVSPSFTVITGHTCGSETAFDVDYANLAHRSGTLVVLMGMSQLQTIVSELVSAGKPGTTPVAVVRWGTRADQGTLIGTLDTIVQQVKLAQFKSPAIVVIGEVVRLRDTLSWVEGKPLFGKRVVVTADTVRQAADMACTLQELGAETYEVSSQAVSRVNVDAVDSWIRGATQLHGDDSRTRLYFSSSVGVHAFFGRWRVLGYDIRGLARCEFAATNAVVRAALVGEGIQPDLEGTDRALVPIGHRVLVENPNGADVDLPLAEWHSAGLDVTVSTLNELNPTDVRLTVLDRNWLEAGVDLVWAASADAYQVWVQAVRQALSNDGDQNTSWGPKTIFALTKDVLHRLEEEHATSAYAPGAQDILVALAAEAQGFRATEEQSRVASL